MSYCYEVGKGGSRVRHRQGIILEPFTKIILNASVYLARLYVKRGGYPNATKTVFDNSTSSLNSSANTAVTVPSNEWSAVTTISRGYMGTAARTYSCIAFYECQADFKAPA